MPTDKSPSVTLKLKPGQDGTIRVVSGGEQVEFRVVPHPTGGSLSLRHGVEPGYYFPMVDDPAEMRTYIEERVREKILAKVKELRDRYPDPATGAAMTARGTCHEVLEALTNLPLSEPKK